MTIIPADKWDEFMAWLDAPPDPKVIESLRRLFARPLPWEENMERTESGKLQAVIVRTIDYETVVVIGHDLIVERHGDHSDSFAEGLRKGMEASGIEVLP